MGFLKIVKVYFTSILSSSFELKYIYQILKFKLIKYTAYSTPWFNSAIKGSPVIHILSQINPILRIVFYFLKFQSNIVVPSMPRYF